LAQMFLNMDGVFVVIRPQNEDRHLCLTDLVKMII
jgi:hypothetical protein